MTRCRILMLVLLTGLVWVPWPQAEAGPKAPNPQIVTFDAPGAGTGAGQGTVPQGINPEGTVAGQFSDSKGVGYGFVRAHDGTIVTFAPPGAGTGPGQGVAGAISIGFPFGCLNPAGTFASTFIDANNVSHGFLRNS